MIVECDCGSFVEHGFFGDMDDKVTSVYLRLSQPQLSRHDGVFEPTRITVAPDVYLMFASCLDIRHPKLLTVAPTRPMYVYQAAIELDRELTPGSLKMWEGPTVVASMDGWTE